MQYDLTDFGRRVLTVAFVAALAIPLALDGTVDTSGLAYDVRGNGCRSLTPAGEAGLDAELAPLRISLLAWTLTGAAVLTLRWLRRLDGAPRRFMVLGGWLFGAGAAAPAAWAGPGMEGFGKVGMFVLYLPAIVLVSGTWMAVGARGTGSGRLIAASLVLIAVAINLGIWLGGSDEILSC